jgi:hypothetical protein
MLSMGRLEGSSSAGLDSGIRHRIGQHAVRR